jgi:N-acetylneuraminate synthase
MKKTNEEIRIGTRLVGKEHPTYIIAEIGINHNGDVKIAKKLINAAVSAGCDAVKFQKRTPEVCTPKTQWDVMRDTPWGRMSYIEYRRRIELSQEDFDAIDSHCKEQGISWFASCWDEESIGFLEQYDPPCIKIQSAGITDAGLLYRLRKTGKPLIMSTGMSTMDQLRAAVSILGEDDLVITHATSTYPCPDDELNLQVIKTLQEEFDCPIGYSGHENGWLPSILAVALGACVVERHITLDKTMWGSDQFASLEPEELVQLVSQIRLAEHALGDGIKRVYDSEIPAMTKLRRICNTSDVQSSTVSKQMLTSSVQETAEQESK